ncbi:hypothetical protein [Pararhodonellum marinum]|uniref:hypothetical protein n=1 Tax=Pararhodonellum marinum TaxID=2755358 RepID=UPI00188F042C|nr:hypothetical protein [Pararhodonellum marinum]
MKKIRLYPLLFLLLGYFVISCGDDNGPTDPAKTPEERAIEALAGESSITWRVNGGGSVTKDGNNVTQDFSSFQIRFINDKNYTTQNSNNLFDNSGTWAFVGSNFDKIELSGNQPAAGREISFTQTGNDLNLTFNVPVPNTRTEALAGNYVFSLKKQ